MLRDSIEFPDCDQLHYMKQRKCSCSLIFFCIPGSTSLFQKSYKGGKKKEKKKKSTNAVASSMHFTMIPYYLQLHDPLPFKIYYNGSNTLMLLVQRKTTYKCNCCFLHKRLFSNQHLSALNTTGVTSTIPDLFPGSSLQAGDTLLAKNL